MPPWRAVALGILQGATEFLPVSSSGHLVLVPWALGWPKASLLFDTVVHLGTCVAVVLYFWRDLVALLQGAWRGLTGHRRGPEDDLGWLLVLSAVPGAVIGYLFEDLFESLFAQPPYAAGFLLVTGALLLISARLGRRERAMDTVRWPDALWLGLAQAAAIAPGISRSGATMSAGLLRGLDREASARFAFLMSVPIILGAAVLQITKAFGATNSQGSLTELALGFAAAAVSGLLAIRLLMRLVRRHSLRPFAYYCAAAGLAGLTLALVR
jgi:undecaprenyl-diphosphatase